MHIKQYCKAVILLNYINTHILWKVSPLVQASSNVVLLDESVQLSDLLPLPVTATDGGIRTAATAGDDLLASLVVVAGGAGKVC